MTDKINPVRNSRGILRSPRELPQVATRAAKRRGPLETRSLTGRGIISNGIKKTILIVDDEVPLRTALRDKFTREGFSVREAGNGEEGLAVALHDQPDLILLDIIMPKMDGITMFKKLRGENEYGNTVPIIILTNLTSADQRHMRDMTKFEPAYYLVKTDWKIEDVVAKVRERLDI